MDQSGYKSDFGDSRTCYHKQCKTERNTQRLQHMDTKYSWSEKRRQRTIYVPSKYRSYENAGELS